MENNQPGEVTLQQFADRVECHFTTASRLKSGERLPGRELLGRIIEEYNLDPVETTKLFVSKEPDARINFGAYLRKHIFNPKENAA